MIVYIPADSHEPSSMSLNSISEPRDAPRSAHAQPSELAPLLPIDAGSEAAAKSHGRDGANTLLCPVTSSVFPAPPSVDHAPAVVSGVIEHTSSMSSSFSVILSRLKATHSSLRSGQSRSSD